ncbi:ankyrin repeat-containing domain protein [Usnea florida]
MADPLGITASIIAVLQLSAIVVRYLGNVQDASEYKSRLLLEVSGSKGVLETLRDLSQESLEGETIHSTLSLLKQPLGHHEATLRRLENALAPAQGLKRLGKAFKWPFEKSEITDILRSIESQKALFGLALQADHLELSRAIMVEVESLKEYHRNEEMRRIISWISPLNFPSKHQDIFAKHQKGTGSWLFNDPKFLAWKTGKERILWCPGVPGAGKTVITSMVVDHLNTTSKEPDVAVVGIYCDYNEFNQQSTPKYIASLLVQLLQKRSFIPREVEKAFEIHGSRQSYPTLPEYIELLKMQMDSLTRVYIIIDALDECTQTNGVRDELFEGVTMLPECVSIMITSRYIPDLEILLENALRLDIRAHDEDVHIHVVSRLKAEKHWARRIRLDSGLQSKIAKSIVERTHGMFLLAQLHVSSIVRKHSRKEVEKGLMELPVELDSTYEQILKRINNQGEEDEELARGVLSWLTFAHRPLTFTMLQQALAITPGDSTFDEDAIIHEESLLSVCAGLVVIDKETEIIRFVHYTAQEYFSRVRKSAFPSSPLNVVLTCLTFLLFEQATKEEMPSLYTYAADHWGHHARDSPETDSLVDMIIDFLDVGPKREQCVDHMSASPSVARASLPIRDVHLAAKFDLEMTMSRLLERPRIDVNVQDSEGKTPLYYSAGAEHGAVAKRLMKRSDIQVDLSSYHHGPPLHNAIESRREHIAQMLLDHGASVESKDNRGVRPVHKAIICGQANILRRLLDNGVDVKTPVNDGRTAFSLAAAEAGRALSLSILLESITVNDIKEGRWGDLLVEASYCNASFVDSAAVVQAILDKGADVSLRSKDYNQRTALHCAAETGQRRVVEVLLHSKCDADSQDQYGLTPLHYAVISGHEDIVQLLLPRTKSINQKARDGRTPWSCAKSLGRSQVKRLLEEAGAEVIPDMREGLESSDASLRSVANSSREESRKNTARLFWAAENGDLEALLLALRKGVDANEKDLPHGKTALHWAAEKGYLEITEVLLERGSDVRNLDRYRETPLHYAASSGHEKIVNLLLQHNSDPTVLDNRGRTALRCARDNDCSESVRLLLPRWTGEKMDLAEKDGQGRTVVHWAADLGCEDAFATFARLGLSEATIGPDSRGWTPLRYAIEMDNMEMTELLQAVGLEADSSY